MNNINMNGGLSEEEALQRALRLSLEDQRGAPVDRDRLDDGDLNMLLRINRGLPEKEAAMRTLILDAAEKRKAKKGNKGITKAKPKPEPEKVPGFGNNGHRLGKK